MKYIIKFSAILLLVLVACKESKSVTGKKEIKPYAEISIKEGGVWQDGKRGHKEYVGGTFKNVDKVTLPTEHTDHTFYIRYEGPGWENKNIGYRLYLDWRNAIDIYGKKVDTLVLPHVGQDGFDSYHKMSNWGVDVLKVGKSLGIGSYGRYKNDEVIHFKTVEETSANVFNTDKASGVNISYKGWTTLAETIDLKTTLTIFPEGRHTKAELTPSNSIDGLCTGIVKFDDIPLIQKSGKKWAYIATYGAQTLVDDTDKLGMAILYKLDETEAVVKGPHDHLVVFKPIQNITYYFLGAWEQELYAIKNQAEFENHLDKLLSQLETKGYLN